MGNFIKSKFIPENSPVSPYQDQTYKYLFIRVGRIVGVDYERHLLDVAWEDGGGFYPQTPVTFPYAGPRGCIGSMPEKGSVGIFAYINSGKNGGTTPLLLACLPSGIDLGITFQSNKVRPSSFTPETDNELRYKFRKLGYGDMIVSSPEGGELFINKDVQLYNDMMNEFLMRSSDQAIISTSLNNYIFAGGVEVATGFVTRNDYVLFENGKRLPYANMREVTLQDGRDVIYGIPFDEAIDEDTDFYNEYRISLAETSTAKLNYNSVNQIKSGFTPVIPLVNFVLGTYFGSDKTKRNTYGKILMPILFKSVDDMNGQFELTQARKFGNLSQERLALAYSLDFSSGSFLGVDKEGHYFVNLSSSSATNSLGSGRSMSIRADGNLKEKWGRDAANNNSWDLSTSGGVRWNIGNHGSNLRGRSIDITTSKGISLTVTKPDSDGYGKRESISGTVIEEITGSKLSSISGTSDITVEGLKVERVFGTSSENVYKDKQSIVSGVYTTIAADMEGHFGERSVTIAKGDDKLKLLKGNISEILLFGNRNSVLTKGSINQLLTMGSIKANIVKGDFSTLIGNGNATLKSATGSAMLFGTKEVSLTSAQKMTVKSPKSNIVSAMTKIGIAPISPTTGTLTHNCYVTGAPPRGSTTVKISV